jgi:CTP synthase
MHEQFPRLTGECTEHPFFVGLQAHPEFGSRPLNPSPPFLGFVAAAAGENVLKEQLVIQAESFRPPHPEHSMVDEESLRAGEILKKQAAAMNAHI